MFFRLFRKKGQSTAEYAILIGIVIAAAVGIQTYVKRGIQAKFKDTVDNFVVKSSGGTADTKVLNEMQFEHEDYKAKSTQTITEASSYDKLNKDGTFNRLSTETQQLGDDGDYRIYDYQP